MDSLFGISEKEIAGLSPEELADLTSRLLDAESNRFGLLPSLVQTSLRIFDNEGGVDARVRDMPVGSAWIPQGLSIWQFKSGRDNEPAILKKEFSKPRVQEALR